MPRRPTNRRPDLNGLLVIDKPSGVTSFGVCRKVRHLTGGAKVGHAGTLDPLATGVLVLALGKATRLIPQLMATRKRYTAEIDLSAFSTTDDLEGEITPVATAAPPTRDDIECAVAQFVGEIMQRPPVFSAIHIDGRRAHIMARQGALTERPEPRPVTIFSIDILAYDWPVLTLDIACGKGTYIRSLARDLGESLGVGGMLRSLRRTAVGEFTIDQAIPLSDLPDPIEQAIITPPPPPQSSSTQ